MIKDLCGPDSRPADEVIDENGSARFVEEGRRQDQTSRLKFRRRSGEEVPQIEQRSLIGSLNVFGVGLDQGIVSSEEFSKLNRGGETSITERRERVSMEV